jgi:glucosamine-6-phosphate deaminase
MAPTTRIIVTEPAHAAVLVADEVAGAMAHAASEHRPATLAIATGRTPLVLYDELVRRVATRTLSFVNAVVFPLDEFVGVDPDHPSSLQSYLRDRLFRRVDVMNGAVRQLDAARCDDFERAIVAAGGIDLLVLGIGRNGHIGFNEPGSPRDSVTRRVVLAETTREDLADGFGSAARVPAHGVTMGVATMLAARKVRLFAFGATKHEIVRRMLEEPIGAALPASYLREHHDFTLFLDPAAAGSDARRPIQAGDAK